MSAVDRDSPVATEDLRSAIDSVESRSSATADLPPLTPGGHDAAKSGLRLLRYRARSEHELRQRLLSSDHEPESVDDAIDRLRAWGLIDDADFAAEWVRGRRRRRGRSRGALERELRDKGVAENHIADAVVDIDDADERARAVELVRGRLSRMPDSKQFSRNDAGEKRRLVAFLARRGYPTGLAMSVVSAELAARASS